LGRLRHRTAPGFTYFVTTKTWQNRAIFQVPEIAAILLKSILRHRDTGAYLFHDFVIMPNHLHLLVTPVGDTSIERVMQLSVRDIEDYRIKSGYIHNNPVHAGLVHTPEDWFYGSAANKRAMDAPPERLQIFSSGAKAPQPPAGEMSELKLRPPKMQPARGTRC
jgi:putative transposase